MTFKKYKAELQKCNRYYKKEKIEQSHWLFNANTGLTV